MRVECPVNVGRSSPGLGDVPHGADQIAAFPGWVDRINAQDTPGLTLGSRPMKVTSQADLGFPENQSMRARGVEMAAIHVVGSNNDRAPWTGQLGAGALRLPALSVESIPPRGPRQALTS